jgi:hypothetical protein
MSEDAIETSLQDTAPAVKWRLPPQNPAAALQIFSLLPTIVSLVKPRIFPEGDG